MNSFYGGRPGNSFVIITTYRSVADMVENFRLGSQYVAVHYDEYVMINTANKNDPDNGKLYRRGYDFTNEMGGAEYIGTIVGPAGKAPMLEIVSRQQAHNKSAEQGYEERKSSGSASIESESLVPGKQSENVFNDEISWECCSIRTADSEETVAYIGFTIPYPVIEFATEQVQPYFLDSPQDTSYATKIDDGTHPFYSKWKLGIPKGIKGNSTKNLRAVTAAQGIVDEDYQGKQDDQLNSRQILVCDEYDYDSSSTGDPKTKYIGPYNMISGINLTDDGTLTVNYTHDDPTVYNKKLRWVKDVSIDPDTGQFVIHFNHNFDDQGHQTMIQKNLNWVKGIDIDNYGVVTLRYPDSTKDKVLDTKVKWIKDVLINQKGKVTVQWNTIGANSSFDETELQTPLKWIDTISTEDNGTINVKYNTDDAATPIPNALTYINDAELQNDGHFVFKFNNQSKQDIVIDQALKWIESTSLNDNGTITFNYNDGTAETTTPKVKWLRGLNVSSKGSVTEVWNLPNGNGGYQTSKVYVNIAGEGERTFIYRGLRALQVAQLNGVDHLYALYAIKNGTGGRTLDYTFYDETQNNKLVTRAVDGWEDLGPITNFPNLPAIKAPNDTQEFGQQVMLGVIESEGNDWVVDFTMPCSQLLGDNVTGMQSVTSGSTATLRISSDDSNVAPVKIINWHDAGTRVANGFHFRFILESGKGSLSAPIIVTIQCSSFTGRYIGS